MNVGQLADLIRNLPEETPITVECSCHDFTEFNRLTSGRLAVTIDDTVRYGLEYSDIEFQILILEA